MRILWRLLCAFSLCAATAAYAGVGDPSPGYVRLVVVLCKVGAPEYCKSFPVADSDSSQPPLQMGACQGYAALTDSRLYAERLGLEGYEFKSVRCEMGRRAEPLPPVQSVKQGM